MSIFKKIAAVYHVIVANEDKINDVIKIVKAVKTAVK